MHLGMDSLRGVVEGIVHGETVSKNQETPVPHVEYLLM
jgi:hypothetical protein